MKESHSNHMHRHITATHQRVAFGRAARTRTHTDKHTPADKPASKESLAHRATHTATHRLDSEGSHTETQIHTPKTF